MALGAQNTLGRVQIQQQNKMALSLHPIQLAANPEGWRLFTARKADDAFRAFMEKIFHRDQHTCQYCGFQAKQYQEVVNLDQNYRNMKMNNLVTACCFCTQCFFIEAVGRNDYGGGTLIYLPEVTQNELNGFCHVLFCAMANATSYRNDAQAIYRSFKLRSQLLEEHYGEGMSKPGLFGQMLIETRAHKKKIGADLLSDLRLLPSRADFEKQIEAWAAAAMEELPSEQEAG